MVALRCGPFLALWGVVVFAAAAGAEDAVPALIDQLGSGRPAAERIAAAQALGALEDAAALQAADALAQACSDREPEVRRAAVAALGTLLDRRKRPCRLELVAAMFDSSAAVRENASACVLLLSDRMPPEAVRLLLANADHRNPQVRSDVLTTLAESAGADATVRAVLRQAAHDQSLLVRNNAVAGLWKATGDLAAVVPHWLALLDAPTLAAEDADAAVQPLVKFGVAQQLRTLGGERPGQLISVLTPLLADESPLIRGAAARTLGALAHDSEQARPILQKQQVRPAVAALLDDPEPSVRENAAVALDRLPP